jgi:hypothetical protein
MRYTIAISDDVKAKMRALPLEMRRSVGYRIFLKVRRSASTIWGIEKEFTDDNRLSHS